MSEEYKGGSTVRAHRGWHTEAADELGVALPGRLMPRSVHDQRNTPSELVGSSLIESKRKGKE